MDSPTLEDILTLLPRARRYEDYIAGLCPFHADHAASLLVYEDGFNCRASRSCCRWRRSSDSRGGWELRKSGGGRGPACRKTPIWISTFATAGSAAQQYDGSNWATGKDGTPYRSSMTLEHSWGRSPAPEDPLRKAVKGSPIRPAQPRFITSLSWMCHICFCPSEYLMLFQSMTVAFQPQRGLLAKQCRRRH